MIRRDEANWPPLGEDQDHLPASRQQHGIRLKEPGSVEAVEPEEAQLRAASALLRRGLTSAPYELARLRRG